MTEFYAGVLLNGLLIGAVYALVAVGLNLIFGVMRVVNFAHGEMVVVGMYIGYAVCKATGWSSYATVPIAMAALFLFGYGFQRILGNTLLSRPQHVQFVLYIGLALLITGLHAVIFGPDPRGIESDANFAVYRLAGLRVDATRLHAALAALLLIAGLSVWMRSTLLGKALHAAAQNITGGEAIGLRIPHLFALAMGIGDRKSVV